MDGSRDSSDQRDKDGNNSFNSFDEIGAETPLKHSNL